MPDQNPGRTRPPEPDPERSPRSRNQLQDYESKAAYTGPFEGKAFCLRRNLRRHLRFRARSLVLLLLVFPNFWGCAERGTGPPRIESFGGPETQTTLGHDPILRVATANLWGVSVLGLDWADEIDLRFAEFATRLGRNLPQLDIVLIQEAWKDDARRALLAHDGVRRNFPHRVDVLEEPGGAGLVVLSKFPIETAEFHRFAAQGRCIKFWEGDCLSGKGVLAVQIKIDEMLYWVATTHLIACYVGDGKFETACDQQDPNGNERMRQISEARHFMEHLVGEAPAILGGDFNFTRSSRYYPAMTSRVIPAEGAKMEVAKDLAHAPGVWTEMGEREVVTERIDYIWSRPGSGAHPRWQAYKAADLIFTEPVAIPDGSSIPISDHPILAVSFCLTHPDQGPEAEGCQSE